MLQTSVQTPCRKFNYSVHLTASESSYLVYYANNYFEEHREGSIASWSKVLSWFLQLPKRLKFLSFDQTRGVTTLICLCRAVRSDPKSHSAGGGEEAGPGGGRTPGSWPFGSSAGQGRAGETNYGPDKEPGTAGKTLILRTRYTGMLLCPWGRQSHHVQGKT